MNFDWLKIITPNDARRDERKAIREEVESLIRKLHRDCDEYCEGVRAYNKVLKFLDLKELEK